MYNKSEIVDNIKQMQVLIYVHNLMKEYNFCNSKFLTKNVKYLDTISFENMVYGNQDHNATIIVPLKLALQLSLTSGSWMSAKFLSKDFNHRRTHHRWIKIIVDYSLKSDECYISLILYHNIREKLNTGTHNLVVELKSDTIIFNLYLITRLFAIWNSKTGSKDIFLKYKSSLYPKFASEIHISYANQAPNLSLKEVETIIQYYFSIPKYVDVGDILVIPVPFSQSLSKKEVNKSIYRPEFLYFVVNSFHELENTSTTGFLVSKDRTSLFLTGSKLTKIPYLMGIIGKMDEKTVPCLKKIFTNVCRIFKSCQPFDSEWYADLRKDYMKKFKTAETIAQDEPNHSTDDKITVSSQSYDFNGHLILIGPTGSGKIKIIKLLAEKFSYQLKWIDCLSVKRDTSAATEEKLKQVLADIQPYTIIVFIQIGTLSEDKEGNNDPRVFSALKEQFRKLSSVTARPFIIGTNENQINISDDLWSLFTYQLTIPCPSQEERKVSLFWLLSVYFNWDKNSWNTSSPNIGDTLTTVSHRTSGFYIGDLEEYIIRVHRRTVRDATESVMQNFRGKCLLPSHEDFMKVLDEMQEQRSEALGLPRIPKVEWRDVGGLEEAKKELINTIQLPIKHPTIISKSFRRSGILLYGPPGTGKTLLAKSVASECGLNFLSVKGPELINMYIGQSEENVRNVFAKAISASPCVIFFDELDSLAPKRGRSGDSGGVTDRIVSALLTELDGVSTASDVFVLGATNRPDLLDDALLRPGRFEKQIFLGLCDTKEDQIKILKAVTSKIPLGATVSLPRVAESLPFTFTGADFAALATDAFYLATRRVIATNKGEICGDERIEVSENDLVEASKNLKPSVSESEFKLYQNMKKRRAN